MLRYANKFASIYVNDLYCDKMIFYECSNGFAFAREGAFYLGTIAIVHVNKEYAKIVSDISGYHIKNIAMRRPESLILSTFMHLAKLKINEIRKDRQRTLHL